MKTLKSIARRIVDNENFRMGINIVIAMVVMFAIGIIITTVLIGGSAFLANYLY